MVTARHQAGAGLQGFGRMTHVLAAAIGAVLAGIFAPAAAAADPAPVTYDDAMECASLDTVLAGVLGGDDAKSDADRKQAKHYSTMAEAWLQQASTMHPHGQDAAFADYDKAVEALSTRMLAATSTAEVESIIRPGVEKCRRLEEEAANGAAD